MNWLQKIAVPLDTHDLPQLLADAIQYEVGGKWEAGKAENWTERLDSITGKQLGEEVGYSTSFWVTCKEGDGLFHQKWGVSINFTVTSGSSHTTFDSETGDWDLSITASVQFASPDSWTPMSPYALMLHSAGHQEDMKTIQEVAKFVKRAIWNDQQDDDDGDDEGPDFSPEIEPDPGIGMPSPVYSPAGVI